MIIQDIYKKYKVPPHLQVHMYSVAAIGQYIAQIIDLSKEKTHNIIVACLLHDIWNILKFEMSLYPDVWEPEWVDYRTTIKEEFKKYGWDEKEATFTLCKKLNISQEAYDLVYAYDTTRPKDISPDNIQLKLIDYSDWRVMVYGIGSLQERINNLISRNIKNKWRSKEKAERMAKDRIETTTTFEQELIESYGINPSDISNLSMQSSIKKMRLYDIHSTPPKNSFSNWSI